MAESSYSRENLLPSLESKPKDVSFLQLYRYASKIDKFLLFFGCLLAVFAGLAQPILAFMLGKISQSFITMANRVAPLNETDPRREEIFADFHSEVAHYCLIYSGLGLLSFFIGFITTMSFSRIGENLSHRLRKIFFHSLLKQDIAWFDSQKTGALSSQLFSNIDQFKTGTGEHIGLMLRTFSMYIGGFAICLYFDWKLTIIGSSMSPIIAILGYPSSKRSVAMAKEKTDCLGEAGAAAEQAITSIRTVMFFNGQQFESSKYERCLQKLKSVGCRNALHDGLWLAVFMTLIFTAFFLTVWVGTGYVYEGRLEGGFVISLFMIVMNCTGRMDRIFPLLSGVNGAKAAAIKIYEIIEGKPKILTERGGGSKIPVMGNFTLQNVGFSYPSRSEVPVISNVSFTVEAGKTVALVGSSGSGKSTILQLLLRFYDPIHGKILVDGVEIDQFDLKYLREIIGIVSQEPVLFNTTIEENIKFGRDNLAEQEIWAALKTANAYDFVKAFPLGLKTLVGDRGAQLSGGQKQRIAIARALVRDPKILLLDEATSALDAESETVVQQALENASVNRTTIIVAHRLSTIRNADQIIVMHGGEIAETGTHNELVEKKGVYFSLVNRQIFEEKKEESNLLEEKENFEEVIQNSNSLEEVEESTKALEDPATSRLKKELKEEKVPIASLWRIVKEARPEWCLLFFCFPITLFEGLVNPGLAFVFTQVVKVYSGPKEEILSKGHLLAFVFLALGALYGITLALKYSLFGKLAESFGYRLQLKVYRNILRQDAAFFDKPSHASGRLLTRLSTDTENIKPAINLRLGTVFSNFATNIIATSFGFYFGWQMAIITLPLFSISYAGLFASFKYRMRRDMQDQKDMEASGKIANESLQNIRTVQALNLQDQFYKTYCEKLAEPLKQSRNKTFIQSFTDAIVVSLDYFLYAICFRWGLFLIYHKYMEAQYMLQALILTGWCSISLGTLFVYLPDYAKAKMAAALVFKLMDEEPAIDGLSKDGRRSKIEGEIKIKNLHFRYPERPDVQVLRGIDLEMKQGETVALVGASGCGKSTIVSLLERMYDPEEGRIEIDGIPIDQINTNHLRANISIVSQEPILFDMTIKENILYGLAEENISHLEMIEAAKKANIHDFIACLPEGYGTRVGDKGTQLSGGQKQRIAIARALVRKPRILILDEATSALDTESEKHVQLALDQAKTGRSCLVIAHRLSTIRHSDLILVFKEGRVAERGTHDELMAIKGVYFNLTQKQNLH